MIYYISRNFLWLFFKIFFRYKASNVNNFPKKGPFIMASNHLSFLDPVAVGIATMRKVHFMARSSLYENTIFKIWATAVGVIPVKRGRFDLSAIKGTLKHLKRGEVVALFPEGTRSKDGTVKDAKAGVGYVAVKALAPVVPVCIKGSDKALPHHASFIRFRPVETRVGEPVRPEQFKEKDGTYNYEGLSKEVMRRIVELGKRDGN